MTGPGGPGSGEPEHLRVLHLDHTSTPGGAEYALRRMLAADPAWSPAVLTAPGGEGDVFAPLRGRIPVRIRGVRQNPGAARSVRAALGAAARLLTQAVMTRFDPAFRTADIVDANSTRSAAYGALAAVGSRAVLVVHLRDLVEREALGGFGFALMSRLVLRRAQGVIANSRATLEAAEPYLRADALTAVIPSASGLVRSGPRPADGAGPLRIGMLARIDPWKGQALLLEAFARGVGSGDAILEFAGAPLFGHSAYLEQLKSRAAELGVADRVAFLGHIDPAEVLARWDVAVQYSLRREPMGQNVLQYLAAGCATVVAEGGGPAEWVRHENNGLTVPPQDVDALAEALRRLQAEPALRARLQAAARATPGLLSDAEVALAHADFYRGVRVRAAGPRPRREP